MNIKTVDIENWERKKHYQFFRQLDYPHFNICANVEITQFYKFIKGRGESFFVPFLFAATKTANDIKEFRYRIRGDSVVEHELVHPSFTLMGSNEVFSFCTAEFTKSFEEFIEVTQKKMDRAKNAVLLEDEPDRDDLLYITSIPWVSFTSIIHPVHMTPVDSIPRISWGKFFEENGKIKLPISVQAHHALVDGLHVGRFFQILQQLLDNPEIMMHF